jgi:hypothetical protein
MLTADHELEFLLSLDDAGFQFGTGYGIEIEARRITAKDRTS